MPDAAAEKAAHRACWPCAQAKRSCAEAERPCRRCVVRGICEECVVAPDRRTKPYHSRGPNKSALKRERNAGVSTVAAHILGADADLRSDVLLEQGAATRKRFADCVPPLRVQIPPAIDVEVSIPVTSDSTPSSVKGHSTCGNETNTNECDNMRLQEYVNIAVARSAGGGITLARAHKACALSGALDVLPTVVDEPVRSELLFADSPSTSDDESATAEAQSSETSASSTLAAIPEEVNFEDAPMSPGLLEFGATLPPPAAFSAADFFASLLPSRHFRSTFVVPPPANSADDDAVADATAHAMVPAPVAAGASAAVSLLVALASDFALFNDDSSSVQQFLQPLQSDAPVSLVVPSLFATSVGGGALVDLHVPSLEQMLATFPFRSEEEQWVEGSSSAHAASSSLTAAAPLSPLSWTAGDASLKDFTAFMPLATESVASDVTFDPVTKISLMGTAPTAITGLALLQGSTAHGSIVL